MNESALDEWSSMQKQAWALRKQTQGNIFVCFAALITKTEDPIKYVYENKAKEALNIYNEWRKKIR